MAVTFHLPRFQKTCNPTGWRIKGNEYLGSGISGDVYKACLGSDCDYVAKVMHIAPEHLKEAYDEGTNMYRLGQLGLAPRFQTGIVCDDITKLRKIFTHAKQFDTDLATRRENTLSNLQFAKKMKEIKMQQEIEKILKSRLYSVIFSRYVPDSLSSIPADERKKLKPEIRDAVTRLWNQLDENKFHSDFQGPNLRLFRAPSGKWVAKLVDVGHGEFVHDFKPFSRQERDTFISGAVEDLLAYP